MSDIDRPRLALYVVLGLIVCLLGARYLRAQGAPGGDVAPVARTATTTAPAQAPADREASQVTIGRENGGRMTVHVAGAVRRPGVYRMAAGARVDDAVGRAGGAKRGADLSAINLATKLEDGRQVLVPTRAPPVSTGAAAAGADEGGAAAGTQAPQPGGAAPAPPVNLNTATLEQLDTLDGVGPGIGQRILDYREQNGGFRNVEELGQVSGIGEKRLATLTPLVTAG